MYDKQTYQKQYYEQNKQKIKDRAKAHYEANREVAITRATQYNKDHREDHLARIADYASRNPDTALSANKRYREKHKDTLRFIQRGVANKARARAKSKGWDCDVDLDYIASIWPADNRCPVYGTEFTTGKQSISTNASLDRIDSSKGYVKGNLHIISWRANDVKADATLDELRRLVTYLEMLPTS